MISGVFDCVCCRLNKKDVMRFGERLSEDAPGRIGNGAMMRLLCCEGPGHAQKCVFVALNVNFVSLCCVITWTCPLCSRPRNAAFRVERSRANVYNAAIASSR